MKIFFTNLDDGISSFIGCISYFEENNTLYICDREYGYNYSQLNFNHLLDILKFIKTKYPKETFTVYFPKLTQDSHMDAKIQKQFIDVLKCTIHII